jgi:hypothetical protein
MVWKRGIVEIVEVKDIYKDPYLPPIWGKEKSRINHNIIFECQGLVQTIIFPNEDFDDVSLREGVPMKSVFRVPSSYFTREPYLAIIRYGDENSPASLEIFYLSSNYSDMISVHKKMVRGRENATDPSNIYSIWAEEKAVIPSPSLPPPRSYDSRLSFAHSITKNHPLIKHNLDSMILRHL